MSRRVALITDANLHLGPDLARILAQGAILNCRKIGAAHTRVRGVVRLRGQLPHCDAIVAAGFLAGNYLGCNAQPFSNVT